MKQGTANLAEDYCFIHKALRPVGTARRQIAAVPPSNSRPDGTKIHAKPEVSNIFPTIAARRLHHVVCEKLSKI